MNKFKIYEDYCLYCGLNISEKPHKHYFIEIIFSAVEHLNIEINGEVIRGKCFIIDSNILHRCIDLNSFVYVLSIDPESEKGITIKYKYLTNHNYLKLNNINFTTDESGTFNVDLFINELVINSLSSKDKPIIYPKIKNAIKYITDNCSEQITISQIAKHTSLSPSRLQHLFKEQINTPITSYIQLYRIKKTIMLLQQGCSLTHCVMDCGFTDYSHLNRVFKNMFGIAPSIFKNNSIIIQVDKLL